MLFSVKPNFKVFGPVVRLEGVAARDLSVEVSANVDGATAQSFETTGAFSVAARVTGSGKTVILPSAILILGLLRLKDKDRASGVTVVVPVASLKTAQIIADADMSAIQPR